MLQRGDLVPHFKVKTVGGDLFNYSTIWQRKHLLLVRLLHAPADNGAYVPLLRNRRNRQRSRSCSAGSSTCRIDAPNVRARPDDR